MELEPSEFLSTDVDPRLVLDRESAGERLLPDPIIVPGGTGTGLTQSRQSGGAIGARWSRRR
jgi:hypothetical protein